MENVWEIHDLDNKGKSLQGYSTDLPALLSSDTQYT
jgi:hypothetical protein